MSTLDLVKEFRALDDIRRGADVGRSIIGKLSSAHESAGVADLSGIQTLDDYNDGDNFNDLAGAKGVEDPTPTTAAITPLHAPGSLGRDGSGIAATRKPPGGDQQLALERQALDSEPWDSDDDDENAGGGRSPRETRAVTGAAGVSGDARLRRRIATWERGRAKEERSSGPTARGFPSIPRGDADETSSAGSYSSSDPNVSSPTRPAEGSSDWDRAAGRSSGDDENEGNPRLPHSLRPEFVLQQQSDVATHGASPAARRRRGGRSSPSPPSPCLHSPMGVSSPVSEPGAAASGPASASGEEAVTGSASSHERRRRASPLQPLSEQSCGPARQGGVSSASRSAAELPPMTTAKAKPGKAARRSRKERASERDGLSGTRRGGEDEAGTRGALSEMAMGPGEAATISALRSELSTLREHVLRSEREREAQLREFRTRLEAQERRRPPSADCTEFAAPRTSSPGGGGRDAAEAQPAAFVGDGAVENGRRQDAGGGQGTPEGAAVHNPFAGTGGGAASTPRDHFPAFEDALLDGGDEDEDGRAARLGRGEDAGEETEEDERAGGGAGSNQSVLHDEAFDFSIDTLSHINNHTDFGTHAPVDSALPTATPAISPKIGGGWDGKEYKGQLQKARPWAMADPSALDAGGPSKTVVRVEEEGAEEAFDEKDTAAEEAFFSDACATASLQTPVKHLVAAATAASGLGVAARRGRPGTETPTPGRKPAAPFFKAEQRESGDVDHPPAGRLLHSCGSLRSGVGRASSGSQAQSPGLCMADFFARASAELDGQNPRVDGGGGQGGMGGLPVTRGTAAVEESRGAAVSPSEGKGRERSAGVDASCQTDWSFSAADEVRFVSVPVRSPPVPLSVRMADGRGCPRDSEDDGGWRSLGSRVEENPEEALSSRTGRGAPCFTPKQSQATLCQTPRRCPKLGCAERPRLAGGAGPASQAASFFNSPNLSPIPAARAQPEGAAPSGSDDAVSTAAIGARIRHTPSSTRDWKGGDGEDGRGESSEGGAPRVSGARRQQRFEGLGHGLSPILSEREVSASPAGEGGRRGFDPRARDEVVETSRGWTTARVGAEKTANSSPGRAEGSGWRNSPNLSFGTASARRGTVAGSSGSGPLFMDSSVDVTRSSVLRASTTLNTMAPLGDTGTSLCCSSRAGISFVGELFADSRLRVSSGAERSPRYDVFLPLREQQTLRRYTGGGGNRIPPPCPLQQRSSDERRRRSRSAPPPASDWLPQRARSEANRIAAAMMAREAPSLGPNVVPPGVVGVWLAAAIEGMFSHNASGGGGGGGSNVSDQRFGAKRGHQGSAGGGVFDLDSDARVASHLPYVCQTPPAHPDRQTAGTIHVPEPGDSPPPPPPPPETPLDGDDEEAVDEEDIFYQRQRLLQRVVSAAAGHGGVLPNVCSARDASLEEEEDQRPVRHTGGSVAGGERGESSRRHSDPLTWKTPSVAAAAAATEAAAASGVVGLAGVSAVVASGASVAYMRRHTSGYWRDRLGMTH